MNSTERHPNALVRMPPRMRPATLPEPATAAHSPRALVRSAPSTKRTARIERAAGASAAAPRPWSARNAMSSPSEEESPPASEAAANRQRPMMNSRRPTEKVG
jgi:hypothetical protein